MYTPGDRTITWAVPEVHLPQHYAKQGCMTAPRLSPSYTGGEAMGHVNHCSEHTLPWKNPEMTTLQVVQGSHFQAEDGVLVASLPHSFSFGYSQPWRRRNRVYEATAMSAPVHQGEARSDIMWRHGRQGSTLQLCLDNCHLLTNYSNQGCQPMTLGGSSILTTLNLFWTGICNYRSWLF